MATISRIRRLVNPGRRRRVNKAKRRMTPAQIKFFGTKRQKAALKTSRTRKRNLSMKSVTGLFKNRARRKRNVGSIITVWPKGNPGRRKRYKRNGAKNRLVIVNPGARMAKGSSGRVISGYGSTVMNKGRKKNMARTRKRTRRVARRVVRRRRAVTNPRRRRVYSHRRRRVGNPGYHRRRKISNRRHYPRNPGMLSGTAGRVLGVIGGVAVTKLLSGFLPASFATGVLGYFGIGAVAFLQGKLVGKFSKSPALGNDMLVGGLAYLAAKVLNDFFPSIGSYTGMSGMGLIGGSSFYSPQVNLNGNMGRFVVPSATMGAIGAGMAQQIATAKGVGSMRRTGRLM